MHPKVMESPHSDPSSSEDNITGERWDPLGAPDDEEARPSVSTDSLSDTKCCTSHCFILEKFRSLEEEQDLLSSSLFALTTHFAQVQFRLKQIVDAPNDDKDDLLKSLEEFAFRGIPDMSEVKEKINEAAFQEVTRLRRTQQQELIEKLKTQLHELEQYAFESGEADVPQDVVLERQRVILQELKMRINLQLDEQKLYQLTTADVKQQIDVALSNLINPLKVKEHLVSQLKTQVDDLERFINYLQADTKKDKCVCGCALHTVKRPETHRSTMNIVQRTATLLHMFALLQLGCGPAKFRKNDLKTSKKINHYGDIRARLELAIAKVRELAAARQGAAPRARDDADEDDGGLTTAVRAQLATCLRDLMEHGAAGPAAAGEPRGVVPFRACFARRGERDRAEPPHAWDVVVGYYALKNGERFNATPARKLSQSFGLDVGGGGGGGAAGGARNMLGVIGDIAATHSRYKRSYDSHFKAFVCAGLNANKLVTWLALIYQCRQLINMHYLDWSYAVKTGFQDALQSLDSLTKYKFNLPVDLAIRQFQNIKDVFT